MFQGVVRPFVVAALCAVAISACGGSPTSPKPPTTPTPPPTIEPPANVAPTIESIAVQGRRLRQPPRFADLGETVDVTATVTDPETALDELTYEWTATAGTFSGAGRVVSWTAPDATIPASGKVTLTLKVIEKYGHPGQPKNFSQDVTKTVDVALHDSVTEVRRMSEQFLLDFSDTNIKDWQYIMRNFNASACPNPKEVELEKDDVIRNYTEYEITTFKVGEGKVTVNFGGFCPFRGKQGDACATVPVLWDSRKKSNGARSLTNGNDIIAAVYSTKDTRWYLCASDYDSFTPLAPSSLFYGR
jgi:hypothetical protein